MNWEFEDYCVRLRPRLREGFKVALLRHFSDVPENRIFPEMFWEGGKMLRGSLLCLINESLAGTVEDAVPRATAVEMIHAATLLHDDFVDQDSTRRNRPAAWTLEGARKAVLLGDLIFATAINMMNDLSRKDGSIITRAIALMSEGAFTEPCDARALPRYLESTRDYEALYKKINRLKTGSLFGAACQLGAVSVNANDEIQNKFYNYGIRIGEAYQVADDLKEVKRHIAESEIRPDPTRILPITPAYLCYSEQMAPVITSQFHPDNGSGVRHGHIDNSVGPPASSRPDRRRGRLMGRPRLWTDCEGRAGGNYQDVQFVLLTILPHRRYNRRRSECVEFLLDILEPMFLQ
ncbi:MAG: polyprenyl synthetase family protein [bacterium]